MEWQPISTAPRDGTPVTPASIKKGVVEEFYTGMCWNPTGTSFVQEGFGIWEFRNASGELSYTWSEKTPGCGPTHWRTEKLNG